MPMNHGERRNSRSELLLLIVTSAVCLGLITGCEEIDTLKRELIKTAQNKVLKKKNPFTPREGMTIRSCSLYHTANPNSEIIRKLPAETPLHLIDKVGEYYRVRSRDGREGYVEQKVVGGDDLIQRTYELRKSIEGLPPQAEGVTKTKANFRLSPGREHEVIEILPPGKKFEVYERVVTARRQTQAETTVNRGRLSSEKPPSTDLPSVDESLDDPKKDVWYKVKIEDGRVGYLYTHNMKLTPPEDIGRAVPFMRMVAWRSVNVADDPDMGAKNNYVVAYAPIGKDSGCDYTRLYLMNWSPRLKRRSITWQQRLSGVMPITNYNFEGKPGFSVRYLHPSKKDKLVLASYAIVKGNPTKVSEEEIPNTSEIH
jgi:hypothetical protein